MGRIQTLESDLASRIAAGEVVERPASVVKELVENAIDAGATRVKVEVEQGGVSLVRVSDDGEGMDADDAPLALQRHATSKIRAFDDLSSLTTFGFRGEALPSIASVSKLKLITRARGATEGVEVSAAGKQPCTWRPTGAPEGTSVEVRELFFNVPARLKFLKAQGTEAAHVTEAVMLAALARHKVSFFLVRDGRAAREWLRSQTRADRARQAFEGEYLAPCLGEAGLMRVEAHLSAPERARAGAVALHLVVNGRTVRDRALARAVAQAYGSVLEPGRYPVGVVYLDVPPAQVDVNVHPQKAEVRFLDSRGLLDAVTRELHAGLARGFSVPNLASWARPPFGAQPGRISEVPASLHDGVDPAAASGGPTELSAAWAGAGAGGGSMELAGATEPAATTELTGLARSILDPWKLGAEPTASTPALFEGSGFYASLELLAQVRATFLVCAGSDGLYVLDQHAAAERVTFQRLRRAYALRSITTQQLLVPELVELLPAEVAALEQRAEDVAALGVELRAAGPSSVAVHGLPMLLARGSPERIVRDLVAELGREAKRPFGDAADLVLATMACHGSIRAGDVLSREEAIALLVALDQVDFAGHCPHGRPVVTRIGYDELERRVGR